MANKSVLSNQEVNSAGGSKHGFSLGNSFKFSMSTGMLLPTYSAFVNVGEKISGKPSFFIRADHLAAPVMGDVDVFVDCFFVPLRHLFAPFEQWLFQINDNDTDLISPTISGYGSHHPVINSGQDVFGFVNSTTWQAANIFGGSFGFDLHRLLMHLGYNPQSLFVNLSTGAVVPYNHQAFAQQFVDVVSNTYSPNIPPYKLAAYQKIYYDYYRNTDFENNNVLAYNYDSSYNGGSVSIINFNNAGSSRAGMLELHYRDINKDYFTAIHPAPLFSGIGMLPNANQLLSQLNNWLNVDGSVGNSVLAAPAGGAQAIRPSANHNTLVDISEDDEGRWSYGQDVTGFSGTVGDVYYYGQNKNFAVAGVNNLLHDHKFDIAGAYESLSTATLRSMFAFDKLLRITQRAGKHVDDQTLAHFGFKQPAGISGETYVLKRYHSLFHFGEVTATAATNNADLGQMAGRGVAMLNDQEPFDFVAPCPGIFMCIISCAPRCCYVGAVEKDGFKCYLPDFFLPSRDDLGQQPMFMYETGHADTAGARARWQYRYMEDKVKFDKASFVFTTNEKAPWAFAYQTPYISDTDNVTSAYRARFKVKPTDINNVFVQGYQQAVGYPTNTDSADNFMNFGVNYLTDPFNVDFNMNFKRVSKMSIYGEPVLGGIC